MDFLAVVLEASLLGSGRFLSVLQPHFANVALLVNRFPVLISQGDHKVHGFIANAAD
jgi:hypothetical protein